MTRKPNRYDGPNWRDDPLEHTPPVRRNEGFLRSRGYPNPTLTRLKFELVDEIRHAVERKNLRQGDLASYINRFDIGGSLSQPDISRILNGNVERYSAERLMLVLAALDNRVSVFSKPVEPGHGCVVVEHREPEFA